MALTPDPAPTLQQLLAFYVEAGVDCALGEEPVNWLADAEPAATPREAAPARPAVIAPILTGLAEPPPAPEAAIDRDATRVCRRQSEGTRDVRRRSALPRRGHRGIAVRRPLRQAARPHDRGDWPRPQQGLYRQRDSMAAAGQSHADAAGNSNLPALHPAPDRAGESRHPGHARQPLDTNAAWHARRHHAHPRQMVRLRYRHPRDPRAANFPPGLSAALAVLQADVVAGFARDREGAGGVIRSFQARSARPGIRRFSGAQLRTRVRC